jgi:predicted lipid-binding transport protein (Tim44 family)
MKDFLFDAPLWVLCVLVAAGVAIWWAGNNRVDKAMKRIGLVVLLAGVALALMSFLFDTDQEKVTKQTGQLVQAVNTRDWDTFAALLAPQTRFAMYGDRTAIVKGARQTADDIGLKSVRVTGMTVDKKDTVITVDLRAVSEQDRTMGRPVVTDWRFDWQNLGSGWKLMTITPLKGEQVTAEEIQRNLSRVQ